eukprot:gene12596-13882_t
MVKINVTVIYREERKVVEWDRMNGMQGLKWQIGRDVVKDRKLRFTLENGEGEMLREVGEETEVHVVVKRREGRGKRGRKDGKGDGRKDGRKDEREPKMAKYIFNCS